MTREEFVEDLKKRALELARAGDLQHAVAMVALEANKRTDVKIHHAHVLGGTMLAMSDDRKGVISWIESIQ